MFRVLELFSRVPLGDLQKEAQNITVFCFNYGSGQLEAEAKESWKTMDCYIIHFGPLMPKEKTYFANAHVAEKIWWFGPSAGALSSSGAYRRAVCTLAHSVITCKPWLAISML